MAIEVATTAATVKPATVNEPNIKKLDIGTGGVTAGAIVCMGTDGVVLADGSTGNCYRPIGIAIETVDAGHKGDIAVAGAVVVCVTGASEGSECFPKDGTAGAYTHTQSTKKYSVGIALSATKVLVQPGMTA